MLGQNSPLQNGLFFAMLGLPPPVSSVQQETAVRSQRSSQQQAMGAQN
jgi:hypothetical protein